MFDCLGFFVGVDFSGLTSCKHASVLIDQRHAITRPLAASWARYSGQPQVSDLGAGRPRLDYESALALASVSLIKVSQRYRTAIVRCDRDHCGVDSDIEFRG